jgi:hypothetical protein
MRQLFLMMILAVGPWLAACDGGGKTADIPFGQVREAMNKDAAAFQTYFPSIKGQTVQWSGRVTEVSRQRGDDYVEEIHLFVDMDQAGHGSDAADVTFQIPVSAAETVKAGQPVSYVAVVREFERNADGVLLKLELKELKK